METPQVATPPPRVLVTPRSLTLNPERVTELLTASGFDTVLGPAGRQPQPEELEYLLAGCVGWIAGVEPIGADILRGHPGLRVISRFGVGANNIDLEAARNLGVRVRVATGANARSVAELALGLTIDGIREITYSHALLAAGKWERSVGKELGEIVVAVAGYGAIGRIFADLLVNVGATVRVYDPMLSPEQALPEGVSRADSLSAAIAGADVLSFHCPPAGAPLFDAGLLEHCEPGIVVVNTARSELVDDDAMRKGLADGVVSIYAVDAFDSEPPERTELLEHPRVIATPHIGASTEGAIARTLAAAVDNLSLALDEVRLLRQRDYSSDLTHELSRPMGEGQMEIHWLGQAGFVIRTSRDRVIVIDAYLSDSLASKYRGTLFPHVRMMEPPISADAFPQVDLVMASHGHTDHMDPGTLSILASSHPHAVFVAPERVRELAVERGMPPDRFVGAKGGEVLEPYPDITVHPIPAAHETLDISDEGSAYLGYIIEVDGLKIYHSGDCVPFDALDGLLSAHRPHIALLPVNGRDERRSSNGVPGNFTLDEALELCSRNGIPMMIAHHWGMFDFNTVEPEALYQAWLYSRGGPAWYIPSAEHFWEYRLVPSATRGTRGNDR